jgi:hypothetical protein
METPTLGSLEAADRCYDCRRTGRGLASQRELGIVGPQRLAVERSIIDRVK